MQKSGKNGKMKRKWEKLKNGKNDRKNERHEKMTNEENETLRKSGGMEKMEK